MNSIESICAQDVENLSTSLNVALRVRPEQQVRVNVVGTPNRYKNWCDNRERLRWMTNRLKANRAQGKKELKLL
jgi:hypothetical protein